MFVAPPEKEVEWSDSGLEGSFRFLARVWRAADQWRDEAVAAGSGNIDHAALSAAERGLRRKTHDTIKRVTVDIDQRQQMNTAVSAMMELVNELYAFTDKGERSAPSGQGRARGDRIADRDAVAVCAAHDGRAVGRSTAMPMGSPPRNGRRSTRTSPKPKSSRSRCR